MGEKDRMFRFTLCGALAASMFALAPTPAESQSFNCARASTPTERAICQNPMLGNLDEEMADIYQNVRARLSGNNRQVLIDEQRAWLRARDNCGASVGCIQDAYNWQIGELFDWGVY